eukprot:scaffold2830_cov131-Cylindrotheca_fusiformis.AAC.10
MPEQILDESYNPLRIFGSVTTMIDADQEMIDSEQMDTGIPSTEITNLHMIHFDPDKMIQDCDDFSISSREAESFVDDDFCFVSSNSDAFWEQGVLTISTPERQRSASNVTITSEDGSQELQTSSSDTTQDS